MVRINQLYDQPLDHFGARGIKIYYNNLNYCQVWVRIFLFEDLIRISKKVYFQGNPFHKSERILKREFYENSNLMCECLYNGKKIGSPNENIPAVIEYSKDGIVAREIYNEDLTNEILYLSD